MSPRENVAELLVEFAFSGKFEPGDRLKEGARVIFDSPRPLSNFPAAREVVRQPLTLRWLH
jgi:hypothetical protein